MSELELIALFVVLPVPALVACVGLILFALRGDDGHGSVRDDGGSGDDPRDAPRSPLGGPPLLNARPARVRLRDTARLRDRLPVTLRRGSAEPRRAAPIAPTKR